MALGSEPTKYPVLSHADYVNATGCDVYIGLYERSLRVALTFLVFEDEPVSSSDPNAGFENSQQDAHYVRRHSREAIGAMYASRDAGGPCLHPTVEKIGNAVGYPESTSHSEPAVRVRKAASDIVEPYLMTSRATYVQETDCLVSRSTYSLFRVAFFEHVLSRDDAYDAAARMQMFLRETAEGKSTEGGFLDSKCMTPTMQRIASELDLLDQHGRFATQ